jgi:hypothetical protein
MSDVKDTLMAQLDRLAEEPALGSGVSAERARLAGRRTLRRRRMLGAAGGVGTAGLALAVVLAVLPVHKSAPTAAPLPAAGTANTATTPVDTGTDPLISPIKFGWLPSGEQVGYATGGSASGSGSLEAANPGDVYEYTVLTVSPDGLALPSTLPTGIADSQTGLSGAQRTFTIKEGLLTGTPAPAVNGHQAMWIVPPGSAQATQLGEVVLYWQYAKGDWAQLEVGGLPGAAITAVTVYKIAEGAQIGVSNPIPLPFHDVPQPADLPAVSASYYGTPYYLEDDSSGSNTDYTSPSEMLVFSDSNAAFYAAGQDCYGKPGCADLTLEVDTVPSQESPLGDLNVPPQSVTFDGYPGQLEIGKDQVSLAVYGANGYDNIRILAEGGTEGTALSAPGAMQAYFDQFVTELLEPGPSDWTVHVVQ